MADSALFCWARRLSVALGYPIFCAKKCAVLVIDTVFKTVKAWLAAVKVGGGANRKETMQTLEMLEMTERPPAWNELPAVVQIVSKAGSTLHVRATSLFRDLDRHARQGWPLLQVNIDGRPIAEASVGALNIYLGTAGLRGLARRLGVSWPRTRWDWEALASLIGLGHESKPARRAG